MALTPAQKTWLNRNAADAILSKVNAGQLNMSDLAALATEMPSFAPRYQAVVDLINSTPDPREVSQFENARALYSANPTDAAAVAAINDYLRTWQNTPSARENVAQATEMANAITEARAFDQLRAKVEPALQRALAGQLPPPSLATAVQNFISQWGNLPQAADHIGQCRLWEQQLNEALAATMDRQWLSLLDPQGRLIDFKQGEAYLQAFPVSGDRRVQLDHLMWEWVLRQPNPLQSAGRYQGVFGSAGLHNAEISTLTQAAQAWDSWLKDADLHSLLTFMEQNPDYPFITRVQERINALKAEALEEIRVKLNSFPPSLFKAYAESGIFTAEELMEAAQADEDLYKRILNIERTRAILPPEPEGQTQFGKGVGEPGVTDVIFFGISSTGKTCVLSGLLLNSYMGFDGRHYSGDYAQLVQNYAMEGVALEGTPEGFVATISAWVNDGRNKYKFNLFEMAGEEFRDRIAEAVYDDGEPITTFEHMGQGAPEILNSPNEKLLFLLIDPTVNQMQAIAQRKAVGAMLSMMFSPENRQFMQRVLGLHFIVTKADTLGNGHERLDRAAKFLDTVITDAWKQKMIEECLALGVNRSSDPSRNGRPMVFPYSLGHFTVGNIFAYDPEPSRQILQVVCDYCRPESKGGFISSVKELFSKPRL